jgi:hypothetical protein
MSNDPAFDFWLKKKQLKKKLKMEERRKPKKMPLLITSLMDALTIILCFLLKSYGDNPVNITQKDGEMELPKSNSTSNMANAIDVHVGATSILVRGEPVVNVKKGKVNENVKRDGADGFFITPLYKKLKEEAKMLKTKGKTSGIKFTGNALVAAHKDIPYRLLSEVLYTANQAEFKTYSFAIVKTRE